MRLATISGFATFVLLSQCTLAAAPPIVVVQDPPVGILSKPDGSFAFYNLRLPHGPVVRETISGEEFRLEPVVDIEIPPGNIRGRMVMDAEGELHEVYLQGRGEGRQIAVDRFIDLWHRRTSGGRARWEEPQRIWDGYCGALMHFTRLESGRIIAPFGEWLPGLRSGPPTGPNVVTAVYTDDGGRRWQKSPAQLTSPCYADFNGSNYGACEPVVLPLADGRLYMVMRTQTGFLYESWSDDEGTTWEAAAPSRFPSSTGPPGMLRLPDGRIVLCWNHCEMPPRVEGQGVYGGRDALHAAISEDEGQTWRGFREVYRDPLRNQTPPRDGDRGTAYPALAYDARGLIVLISGQGRGRRNLVLIEPEWLTETHAEDDFAGGHDAWHTFKPFGPASRYWRDRAVGPVLIDEPTATSGHALHLRRPDDRPADGATWNFPMGRRGELRAHVMFRSGFRGASIALTDRMFEPTDDQGEAWAQFRCDFDAAARSQDGIECPLDTWQTLVFTWDLDQARYTVKCGDEEAELPLMHPTANGISYVRFRSTADEIDDQGFYVDTVQVDVAGGAGASVTREEKGVFESQYRQLHGAE